MQQQAMSMVLKRPHEPLAAELHPTPEPARDEVLVRVEACGVCRTDLHLMDGELPGARYPVVPGHEAIGRVVATGADASALPVGERVGISWLASACGTCVYCLEGHENLCDAAEFTGCTRNGGYATHMVAKAAFCVRVGMTWRDPVGAAPLLCAGSIGWRALRLAGSGHRLGVFGFGAAAHILLQIARSQGREVHAFTRDGDEAAQAFARSLGAVFAGPSGAASPGSLDAAIIFAPVGDLVPVALQAVRKGGRVVCGGIHMSDIPSMPYRLLWEERQLVSVANLTRDDARGFFDAAASAGVTTHVQRFELRQANGALDALRHGRFRGAAVLVPP